jgi:putative ABC transport system permease protein
VTALAHRVALGGPRMGGVAARRALIRWAGRMFRREWRQQLLVVALLTVAVTAAIGSITIVYNTAPADNAEHGSANYLLWFDGSRPETLEAELASTERQFGTIERIGHRSVAVPGSVETLDFRAQDPHGAFGSELLAVRRGSYPTGPRQVAVTDGVAKLLRVGLGSTLALDGGRRTVVGIVENPRKLSDEFALVSPSSAGAPDHVTVLIHASGAAIDAFRPATPGGEEAQSAFTGSRSQANNQTANTLAMFSVATVFLLLASLVAAAGFAVVAQRRLRQLGMLTATGATPKHLRLVLVTNGALVGMIATVAGTLAGLALWVAVGPTLEAAVDHRIDRLSLPLGLIGVTALLAVLAATGAAWWPARTAARVPIMHALSGRPPEPRPARHAAIAATVLIAVGIGCLALSDRDRPPLIIAGILATILGCLLLGPAAIRVFSSLAGRVPVAPRLALRDLVRYQARSGAALAAVALALGIAATAVVITSAEEAKEAAAPPNLSDHQIRVHTGPPKAREQIPADASRRLDRQAAGVAQIAAQLDGATVVPLHKVIEPRVPAFYEPVAGARLLPSLDPARKRPGPSYTPEAQLFVATPAVLRYLGIDPATVDPGTDFLADRSVPANELVIPKLAARGEHHLTNVQPIEVGRHLLGAPGEIDARKLTFITPAGLRRLDFRQVPAGWLVESRRPLTSDQIADARTQAANAGLTLETRREEPSFATAMTLTTAAGALLALGILALTVGLIRGESAADLRTLTATGASSRIRRTLTATTAGALALLGALLGVAGAYVALSATYYDDLGYLSDVPILYLLIAVVGVPLAATATGFLIAGREPPAIARPVIE